MPDGLARAFYNAGARRLFSFEGIAYMNELLFVRYQL